MTPESLRWCTPSIHTSSWHEQNNMKHELTNKITSNRLLLFSLALQPSAGYGLLISRGFLITHNDAPQSVGLLWTSDQLVAETSTRQHTTHTTDIHALGGIRTHERSRRAATGTGSTRLYALKCDGTSTNSCTTHPVVHELQCSDKCVLSRRDMAFRRVRVT
jgi:hypothetical protein